MNRSYLTSALSDIAESKGYAFRSAPQEYMNSLVSRYPAAFMPYPEFRSIEGRRRGRITYRLTLHLLADGARLSPADRERSLDRLERDMLDIFCSLSSRDRVLSVENLSLSPSALTLTTHGELAMTATADVVSLFGEIGGNGMAEKSARAQMAASAARTTRLSQKQVI